MGKIKNHRLSACPTSASSTSDANDTETDLISESSQVQSFEPGSVSIQSLPDDDSEAQLIESPVPAAPLPQGKAA